MGWNLLWSLNIHLNVTVGFARPLLQLQWSDYKPFNCNMRLSRVLGPLKGYNIGRNQLLAIVLLSLNKTHHVHRFLKLTPFLIPHLYHDHSITITPVTKIKKYILSTDDLIKFNKLAKLNITYITLKTFAQTYRNLLGVIDWLWYVKAT